MTTHTITRNNLGDEGWELICKPGYSIDGQHFVYGDTRSEVKALARDIEPCACADCTRQSAAAN
jgi:hypothetical protein